MSSRNRWALAAMAGVGVIAVVAVRRRRAGHRAPRGVGATTRAHRSAVLAGSAGRAGRSWAVHRARRVFADAARREELDTAHQLRSAEQVAETLGQLKGAMMKLGQMASYLDQGLPEPV